MDILEIAVTAAGSGSMAWVAMRIEMTFVRRDIERLREYVHDPKNPNNLTSVAQDLKTRVMILEEHSHG